MKEFFSLREKSYTLSPQFVKRKAHDRTEKSATAQSGKRGNPRRNSTNFCEIRRTRRLLSTRGKLPKCPTQGFKGQARISPQPPRNRAPASSRRKTRVGKSRASQSPSREAPREKSPRRVSRRNPAASLSKEPRAEPRKAPPAASQNKKPAASAPVRSIGWRCRTPSRTRFPSAGSRTNERATPIPLRRGLCPCVRLPIRRRAGHCSRCR